jgi:D-alanyl-D-alanine carboxypeptidase
MEPEQNLPIQEPEIIPAPHIQEPPQLALPAPAFNRMLVGGSFLVLSIFSAGALIVAYLPSYSKGPAQTQVAAAETISEHADAYAALDLQAKGIYVFDASNDTELFKRNPDAQLPLASITKVALALAVADVLPMESTVTISREAVQKGEGGLTYGEEWRVRDLIDYMLIVSSNTAAEALAEAADPLIRGKYPEAPADEATVWRMNVLAKQLGLNATYFINPSGLDESTTQAGALGSAHDVATLFAYAMRTNRDLFAGTSRAHATLGALNMPKKDVHNTNEALESIPHIYMGKTGLTDLAGGNLAIAFDASENHPIIIVVLGSTTEGRFEDMKKLVTTTIQEVLPAARPE